MYYLENLKSWHDAFTCLGVGVDLIAEHASLEGYDVVIAPNLLVQNDSVVQGLYDFARQGGTVLLTFRCGVKDKCNQCKEEPLPSIYRSLTGISVTEYDPLGNTEQILEICDSQWKENLDVWKKRIEGNTKYLINYCTRWCDLLEAVQEEVDILAVYGEGFYQGTLAVSRHRYGNGRCYYQGTMLQREAYIALAETILQERKMPYYPDLPIGVEITQRVGESGKWQFFFNNTDRRQIVTLEEEMILEPFEMKVKKLLSCQ